jgi:hypothetical protein
MPPRSDKIPSPDSGSAEGDGSPREAAVFIAETLVQLMTICDRHRLDTLGYLLGMAHMEANDVGSSRSRDVGR